MLAQIDDILKAADHAAKTDDRWLFVALLIFGIFAAVLLVRWFIARWDAADVRVNLLQEQLHSVRDSQISYLQKANAELAAIIAKNTSVIEANTVMSNQKMTILTRMEEILREVKKTRRPNTK